MCSNHRVKQPTWPAIRSRSLWPWGVSLRPLLAWNKTEGIHPLLKSQQVWQHTVSSFSPIRVLLHHFEALQSLEDLPRYIPGAHTEVGRAHPVPLPPSVHLDHGSDADPPSQVQVTSRGCWRDITDAIHNMFHGGRCCLVPQKDVKSHIPAYQICPCGGLKLLSTCQSR